MTVHHFVSATDPDLRFLDHVIRKADEIREDLGSVNEVFDRAAHRRLIRGEDSHGVQSELDRGIEAARGSVVIDADDAVADNGGAARQTAPLDAMAGEIDLDGPALYDTLEAAMAIPAGRPQLRVAEEPGFYRVRNPDLPGWRDVIDESVRRPASDGGYGPVRRLAFSTEPFVDRLGDLSVFLPRPDALLMHLGPSPDAAGAERPHATPLIPAKKAMSHVGPCVWVEFRPAPKPSSCSASKNWE